MKKPRVVSITHSSPIETLIDRADLRCTVCNAKRGQCDCWTPCPCGWSFRKGTVCHNPDCSQQHSGDPK